MKSAAVSTPSYAHTRTRTIVGLGLSVLFHALILLVILAHQPAPMTEAGDTPDAPLSVHLLPPSDLAQKNTSAAVTAVRAPPKKSGHPKETARKEQPVARKKTVPRPDQQALKSPAPPDKTVAAPTDMMSMLSAARERRRAAGIPDANDAADTEKPAQDADAIARANVEFSQQSHTRGRNDGGGLFQVTFKGVRTAEMIFRGWDVRRRNTTRQLLEIDAGLNGDIDTAIVRKMIEVIREKESGDFPWVSHRLGHVVILSARLRDNTELEDFLKKDYFPYYH